MFAQFRQRSYELEHLDKGDYTAEEYEGCLVELRRINAWLGDTRALRETLLAEIAQLGLCDFSVIDVGAGSGELLRAAAIWTRKTNRRGQFVGVELNARSARAISEESKDFPEIAAIQCDGFRLPFADGSFDYAICSLITHHFHDAAVVDFLRELGRTARRSIFVIDLIRNPLPYYLYSTVGRLFFQNRLIREDGALSILRSFKPEELTRFADQAQLIDIKVTKTFPARLVLSAKSKPVASAKTKTQLAQQLLSSGVAAGNVMTFRDHDVAIAGGGPAGTSAAIHLAQLGFRVLLAEQKKFPRAKLCGEFISPECLRHFEQLGVARDIAAAGGASLTETTFYSRGGKKVTVPTNWFENGWTAIGLSRAEMDLRLLERAKEVGVNVLEEAQVLDPILNNQRAIGMQIRWRDQVHDCFAPLVIDATGRARLLARRIHKAGQHPQRARFVAFKAHLRNARVATGACEIYFYPGGYGGLNNIEGDVSNLCFIVAANQVRRTGSNMQQLLETTLMKNSRAAFTLRDTEVVTDWLSVALEGFGSHKLVPAPGLLVIGDAAAFNDPFTGSGMLMALESGAILAQSVVTFTDLLTDESSFSELARRYRSNHAATFNSRLRVSGWLRRAAFVPRLAETAILFFGLSDSMRRKVAQATRGSHGQALGDTAIDPLRNSR